MVWTWCVCVGATYWISLLRLASQTHAYSLRSVGTQKLKLFTPVCAGSRATEQIPFNTMYFIVSCTHSVWSIQTKTTDNDVNTPTHDFCPLTLASDAASHAVSQALRWKKWKHGRRGGVCAACIPKAARSCWRLKRWQRWVFVFIRDASLFLELREN